VIISHHDLDCRYPRADSRRNEEPWNGRARVEDGHHSRTSPPRRRRAANSSAMQNPVL